MLIIRPVIRWEGNSGQLANGTLLPSNKSLRYEPKKFEQAKHFQAGRAAWQTWNVLQSRQLSMTWKVEADAANYLVNRQSEGRLANGTAKGMLSQQQGQDSKVLVALKTNGNPVPYAGAARSQLCRCRALSLPTGKDKGSAAVIPGTECGPAPLLTQQRQPWYHVTPPHEGFRHLCYEWGKACSAPRRGYCSLPPGRAPRVIAALKHTKQDFPNAPTLSKSF